MSELDTLKENEFKFNKKFGQNFIFDKNLLTAIINDSKITHQDEVLEIGPGAGTLTKIIAQNCKKVVSLEIDKNLEPILTKNLKDVKNSKIIFADALKTDINDIEKNFEDQYKIVANLPYYITTPLIFKFIEESNRVKSLTIMVQKEVAERLVANPGDKNYGTITVMLNYYGEVKILRQVPRYMFTPAPNVDSTVVQITRHESAQNCDKNAFKLIVKHAFLNRRKTLTNNLCAIGFSKQQTSEALIKIGKQTNIRGEELSTLDFINLTNILQLKK